MLIAVSSTYPLLMRVSCTLSPSSMKTIWVRFCVRKNGCTVEVIFTRLLYRLYSRQNRWSNTFIPSRSACRSFLMVSGLTISSMASSSSLNSSVSLSCRSLASVSCLSKAVICRGKCSTVKLYSLCLCSLARKSKKLLNILYSL